MVRSLTLALSILTAAAVVAAQAPAQQPPKPAPESPSAQQPAPRPESSAAGNKVTYTGCIKAGTAADTWVLENAELATKAGAGGAVGTAGASKLAFNLDPAANVNLKSHANHKVELMGTLAPKSTSAAPSSSSAQADRQQFKVESVKMVAATCP
jgi:hypothetical protein